MIISKTPYRISFFGGGTDYPVWYLKNSGAVLSTTVDKYCYISCRILPRFFNYKYRIVWSHIENVDTVSEILHPAVRAGLRYLKVNGDLGLEIHHQGDLPARAGMGSSSSFSVGFIKAISALNGKMIGKKDLGMMAVDFEQNILKENVGSQDQMAAAYGGFNVFRFEKDGSIHVEPVTLAKERINELQSHLMLLYTGTSRLSSDIAGEIIENIPAKEAVLQKMMSMVDRAVDILSSKEDICEFGSLLHQTWTLKQELSCQISNQKINQIYETARQHGAIGGKLAGAGSSGFMILFAKPQHQAQIREALPGYLHVPVRFENQGSTLVHYSDQESA